MAMSVEETEGLPVTEIEGRKVPWDPAQLRKIQEHPCFSKQACHLFGRMHLAVAPKCNIQCNYCIRKFDCVETFETFRLVKDAFPHLMRCLSTNGLLLPDRIDDIADLGIGTVTVTLNAVDPDIGKEIYSFVNYKGKKYTGREAAELLLTNQLDGIREAVKRKILIKVNTVLIPTVNDTHFLEIAKTVRELGVYIQNIMPLIPQYKFEHIKPPTPQEKKAAQDACSKYIMQMTHCRQCRSDAIGRLGKDIQDQFEKK
jgi:nitrogen fixation protein NifB